MEATDSPDCVCSNDLQREHNNGCSGKGQQGPLNSAETPHASCDDKSPEAHENREKQDQLRASFHLPTFSLDDITASPYYFELVDTAVSSNITFFAAFCRHKVGDRLACLEKLFANLSQEEKHYNFGRVLYLTLLWKEGVGYINGLNEQQVADELRCVCVAQTGTPLVVNGSRSYLLQWLKGVAQVAVDYVVSKLNSSSLNILNALAGDDETVIVPSCTDEYSYS